MDKTQEPDYTDESDWVESDQPRPRKRLRGRTKVWIARLSLVGLSLSIGLPVYAWFAHQRKVATMVKVNSPAKLSIKAGNAEDIIQFKMAGIDVGTSNVDHAKEFVFCVEGGDNITGYNLQIAHTTNIQFTYTLYKAHSDENGSVEYVASDNSKSYYSKAQVFDSTLGDYINEDTVGGRSVGTATYTNPSYPDNEVRQRYAEPLYWQTKAPIDPEAVDNGSSRSYNESEDEDEFLNYYVLRISWDPTEVTNDKETDLVYITAQVN